ncbi:MAG: hypothetical protein KME50_16250 [Nostoc desertorum CM1-VF14]|nr:hypothetical protein [Nostoc desertorum CM1-VF14]
MVYELVSRTTAEIQGFFQPATSRTEPEKPLASLPPTQRTLTMSLPRECQSGSSAILHLNFEIKRAIAFLLAQCHDRND